MVQGAVGAADASNMSTGQYPARDILARPRVYHSDAPSVALFFPVAVELRLCYYCADGLAEPDNNAAERALRAVCLGKKNYIFFGSDHGGERGALLYGLIGTCRLNGIDPEAYLRHILSVLPEWPSNKVAELLPWNVDLTNK